MWTLVVAADFFLMSNPLVFVAGMDRALTIASMLTAMAVVSSLPRLKSPTPSLPVLLFLGWLLASATWSIQPSFTLAAWAQTTAIAAVAATISANVDARVLAQGFVFGGFAVSTASLYAFRERLPGSFLLTQQGDVIAGIGTNSNILAYTLVLSCCGACAWVPRGMVARTAWLLASATVVYGLVRADSATGNVTAAAVALTSVALHLYPVARRRLTTPLRRRSAGLLAVAALPLAAAAVRILVGQDLLTFSNRTPLWSAAVSVAADRPLAGFGYGAVWQHPWKPPLLNVVIGEIWDTSGTALSHGHNSAIDLVVEVGMVGVVLMIIVMATAGVGVVTGLRADDIHAPGNSSDLTMVRFVAACLVALILIGVTEPMATIPLGWWVLVLITERRERRRRRTPLHAMRA